MFISGQTFRLQSFIFIAITIIKISKEAEKSLALVELKKNNASRLEKHYKWSSFTVFPGNHIPINSYTQKVYLETSQMFRMELFVLYKFKYFPTYMF